MKTLIFTFLNFNKYFLFLSINLISILFSYKYILKLFIDINTYTFIFLFLLITILNKAIYIALSYTWTENKGDNFKNYFLKTFIKSLKIYLYISIFICILMFIFYAIFLVKSTSNIVDSFKYIFLDSNFVPIAVGSNTLISAASVNLSIKDFVCMEAEGSASNSNSSSSLNTKSEYGYSSPDSPHVSNWITAYNRYMNNILNKDKVIPELEQKKAASFADTYINKLLEAKAESSAATQAPVITLQEIQEQRINKKLSQLEEEKKRYTELQKTESSVISASRYFGSLYPQYQREWNEALFVRRAEILSEKSVYGKPGSRLYDAAARIHADRVVQNLYDEHRAANPVTRPAVDNSRWLGP